VPGHASQFPHQRHYQILKKGASQRHLFTSNATTGTQNWNGQSKQLTFSVSKIFIIKIVLL
jgi:hypothetical protein